jgi:hypothetical protein
MKKWIAGAVSVMVLLSMVLAIGMFVIGDNETADARGTIQNANFIISEPLQIVANGTIESGADADQSFTPGDDAVLFPQFNDVMTIRGAITDPNTRESVESAIRYDEFNDTANVFCIQIWEDTDDAVSSGIPDGIIDKDDDTIRWNFTVNLNDARSRPIDTYLAPAIGFNTAHFTLNENATDGTAWPAASPGSGELRIEDSNGVAESDGIAWPSSGLNYAPSPIYHEVWFVMEDDDGEDLSDNWTVQSTDVVAPTRDGTQAEAGGAWLKDLGTVQQYYRCGFYTQQVYKILGIYNEDGQYWVNEWDNSYPNPNPFMDWQFHSYVPDGVGVDHAGPFNHDQIIRSGMPSHHNGSQDYLLAIQWLAPNGMDGGFTISFGQNFETYDDGAAVLDTIPNNNGAGVGYTDFYWICYDAVGLWPSAPNLNHTSHCPAIDVQANGFAAGPDGYYIDDGDSNIEIPGNGNTAMPAWMLGTAYLDQFDIMFMHYELDLPSYTVDGYYETTFTINPVFHG